MSDEKVCYLISFNTKELPPRNVTEGDKLDIGSGAFNVVNSQEAGLAEEHCYLSVKDGVLSITNLAGDGQTVYQGESLLKGKSYILDDGDEVKIGKIKLTAQLNDEGTITAMSTNFGVFEEEVHEEFRPGKGMSKGFASLTGGKASQASIEATGTMEIRNYTSTDTGEAETKTQEANEGFDIGDNLDLKMEATAEVKNKIQIDEKPAANKVDTAIREIINKGKENIAKSDAAATVVLKPVSATGIKTKKKKPKKFVERPPLMWRLLSFCLDLSLVYGIYYYILPKTKLPLDQIKVALDKFIIGKIPQIDVYLKNPLAEKLITLYLIFAVINLFSNLVLGNNLGFKFLTNQPYSNAFTSRLKGLFKSFLNIITLPLLIFHLPLLFRSRPFSEIFTGVYIEKEEGLKNFLSRMVLIPVLIFIAINIGVLIHGSNAVEFVEEKDTLLEDKEEATEVKIGSSYFGMKIFNAPSEILSITPSVEVTKTGPEFGINFFHIKNKTNVRFSLKPTVNILEVFEIAKTGNPLFHVFYPNIAKCVADKKLYHDKDTYQEVRKLLQSFLSLKLNNLPKYLITNGFFTIGAIKARNLFLEKMKLEYLPKARFFNHSKKYFLQFTPAKRNSDRWTHFLPIESDEFPIYQLEYNSQSKAFSNKILFSYFGNTTWDWQKRKSLGPQTVTEFESIATANYEAFTVVDLLKSVNNFIDINQVLGTKIYNYYYYLVKKVIETENKEYDKSVKKTLKEAITYMDYLNKNVPNPVIKTVKLKLEELREVLLTNQVKFFQ